MLPAARWDAIPQLDISADDFTLCVCCKADAIEARIREEPWRGVAPIIRGAIVLPNRPEYQTAGNVTRTERDRTMRELYHTTAGFQKRAIGHWAERAVKDYLATVTTGTYQPNTVLKFVVGPRRVRLAHHCEVAKMEAPSTIRRVFVAVEQKPTPGTFVAWSYYVGAQDVFHLLGVMSAEKFNANATYAAAGETLPPKLVLDSDIYWCDAKHLCSMKDWLLWAAEPNPPPWTDPPSGHTWED